MDAKISKDISKFKEKVFAGMSWRQCISLGVALIVVIPMYFFLCNNTKISSSNVGWIVIFVATPIMAVGWYEKQGLPLEKYIALISLNKLVYPVKRQFKIDVDFETWEKEELLKQKEANKHGIRLFKSNNRKKTEK